MTHNCDREEFVIQGFSDDEGDFNREEFERELVRSFRYVDDLNCKESLENKMLKRKRKIISSSNSKENGHLKIEVSPKIHHNTNNRSMQDAFVKKINSLKE